MRLIVDIIGAVIFAIFLIVTIYFNVNNSTPLPDKAARVKDLGKGWSQFDLDIEGDKCTFVITPKGHLILARVEEPETKE